jgi:hypothetical protein
MVEIIFLLIAFHFICDYELQKGETATGKNRNICKAQFGVHWLYWLASHSFMHGAAVYFITGSVLLGIAETLIHGIIDLGKCEDVYGLNIDQALHILCKVIWVVIYWQL